MIDEENAKQRNLEAQRIKEWEEKFDEQQRIKLEKEIKKEERLKRTEQLKQAMLEEKNIPLKDELLKKLDTFSIDETKKN